MKRSIFIICVLALFTCNASAAIKQGDIDYEFNFRWSSDSGTEGTADKDVFELGIGVAKQVTRRIQLGVAVGHEERDQGTTDDTVNFFDLKLRYFVFPDETYAPYVGGIYRWYDRDLTVGSATTDKTDTASGFLLGVRREITRHNDIFMEFQHLSYGSNWPVGNFNDGNKILIGLVHQIR